MTQVQNLRVVQGDITALDVDVIVNAANSSLLGGGGVDGAIHRAAGSGLLEECRAIRARQGGCKVGEAVITKGHNLTARFIVHTVGPVWQGGEQGETELLACCYRASLKLAESSRCRSIAFPAISTGIFGFPMERAACIAISECRAWSEAHTLPEAILLVAYDAGALRCLETALHEISHD